MPYNYVLDRKIKKRVKLDVSNDVLIIDEGHNIAQVIEDSNSFKLSTEILIRALGELNAI